MPEKRVLLMTDLETNDLEYRQQDGGFRGRLVYQGYKKTCLGSQDVKDDRRKS